MPAPASSRQPGASLWFSGREGQHLLRQEAAWLAPRLASRPVQPWLWLAPSQVPGWTPPSPRGVRLEADQDNPHAYAGSVRCSLPWPLSSDCIGDVVLQHPPAERAEALLEEAARVLVAGGRVWLCVFNPLGPFRLRGRGGPRLAPVIGDWRWWLQRHGLHCAAPPHYLGPRWRMRDAGAGATASGDADGVLSLRAACVIEAEKRMSSPVGPAAVRWRRGAAPAA